MPRHFKRIGHELRQLLPVWLFFFLAFSLLRLTQSVTLSQFGFHSTTPSLVLLGSLIVAKSFLLLDLFSFVERFNGRPLLYSVVWKTGIYYVGAFVIFCLEQLIELGIKHHSFAFAQTQLSDALSKPRFWVVQLWLVLLLFAYSAARETMRAIGRDHFMSLWFGGSSDTRPERGFHEKTA
jgi:hypothetical protein